MSVRLEPKKVTRDWRKFAFAATEAAVQAFALGENGFSNAVSALFRSLEALRGDDTTETRATSLVVETISYAITKTILETQFTAPPRHSDIRFVTVSVIENVKSLLSEHPYFIDMAHLAHPASLQLVDASAITLSQHLATLEATDSLSDIAARFRDAATEGMMRIQSRRPDYYFPMMEVITGAASAADMRVRSWSDYRAALIRRFEDEPLFGENEVGGVTLAQCYQPLRAYWYSSSDHDNAGHDPYHTGSTQSKVDINIGPLEEMILSWLSSYNNTQHTRLISGGPGSGKSTFAKRLAALLAPHPQWRVVFVPLQRLRGAGALETRIDDYFRNQRDEPFHDDTAPLTSLGRDNHRDWLIIFDGLDELAKEGPNSESAAQEFAGALQDWRSRIAGTANVRFLVLGRAPSMQDARRRLGLAGPGTLYVADMLPQKRFKEQRGHNVTNIIDPAGLADRDQRAEYWARWAIAKGLPLTPPEAMITDALKDLTKDPLLAYLLIFSGYASERWQEAAENRNRIYRAIFDKIWERERTKETRGHLNSAGKETFFSLIQSLGLAAWRGGGRTGDELTFTHIRDIFMRPDLLKKASDCKVDTLDNVALLFYTQRDETTGRGYEFLHKSFGEYLTARGLFDAFMRWGQQVANPQSDFTETNFSQKWIKLTGSGEITDEILEFLRNEARLISEEVTPDRPWSVAVDWVKIAQPLVNYAFINGLPAHLDATSWREAEVRQANGELAMMAVLNACAEAAYPLDLLGANPEDGGWTAGPVQIPAFRDGAIELIDVFARTQKVQGIHIRYDDESLIISFEFMIAKTLSRLRFEREPIIAVPLRNANFDGCYLANLIYSASTLESSSFRGAHLVNADFHCLDFNKVDFSLAKLERSRFRATKDAASCNFANTEVTGAKWNKSALKNAISTLPKGPGKP